ncbi:hypothetical protein B5C34_01390 [Pacificimonas flava]|uniref:TonB-dependent receptor plug domain-containing protein n=2 Tax=Pacificimonas TaxID=1960290 RepID=A0A219B1N2_9SPHN|nr:MULTISPECIES: TonB-dependent receptor plug domain-containing protein [Pacificimonas]MBZ6378130.1 TonB-dependent receptor plug domain-containing protein [Pacificimonas aurantium]OWV32235.1 hypothetical protein B5C34_01390 [Pacificimonas flava]
MFLRSALFAGISTLAASTAVVAAEPTTDPVSLNLSQEAMERRYLTEPADLLGQAPNGVAVTTPGFGAGTLYTLRGVPDVGTYIDGIRLSLPTANLLGSFDYEQIDIGRGAALFPFALPSAGGSVSARSHRPGAEPHGRFRAHYGAFDQWGLDGSLDIASDNGSFGMNLNGFYEDGDGYVDNLATGETLNATRRWGGRLGIRLTPTDGLEWDVVAGVVQDRSLYLYNAECGDLCDDRYSTTGFSNEVDDLLDPLAGLPVSGDKARGGLGAETAVALMSSDMRLDAGFGTFSFVAGYADTDQDYGLDLSAGSPLPSGGGAFPEDPAFPLGQDLRLGETSREDLTASLRLEGDVARGFGYLIGISGFDSSETSDEARVTTGDDGVSAVAYDRLTEVNSTGYSVFGALSAELGAFRLSTGGSFGSESPEVVQRRRDVALPTVRDSFEEDLWSAFADANLALGPSANLFARAARGHGTADFEEDRLGATGAGRLRPVETLSFEAGISAGLFGDAVNLRALGFYLEADNLAAGFSETEVAASAVQADLRNAGAELELVARPFDGFVLTAAGGYQSPEFKESGALMQVRQACLAELQAGQAGGVCGSGFIGSDGTIADPVYAPDFTARADASWRFYIPSAESFITPSLAVDYRGDMETNSANLPLQGPTGAIRADARTLVDAGLSLETDDGWWLVSLECDNCFDETYVDSSAAGLPYLGRPMTWTFRARRKF